MQDRPFKLATLALACALASAACAGNDGQPPSREEELVASQRAALTNPGAWEGEWHALEDSIAVNLTCDRTVQLVPEASSGDPITIVPGAGETFTAQVGSGCSLPFTVNGNVASFSGEVRCSEPGVNGYAVEVKYRTATLTRQADGKLSTALTADVAFGHVPCSVTTSGTYDRNVVPD